MAQDCRNSSMLKNSKQDFVVMKLPEFLSLSIFVLAIALGFNS